MQKSISKPLRPAEIIEAYPQIAEHWTGRELGYMLMLGLVRGKKHARTCEIFVDDILQLLELKKQKAA